MRKTGHAGKVILTLYADSAAASRNHLPNPLSLSQLTILHELRNMRIRFPFPAHCGDLRELMVLVLGGGEWLG